MKAIIVTTPGNPSVLQLAERPIPTPGDGQVLIRVAAAGLNRADLMMRQGKYGTAPVSEQILGLEVAGTIEQTGTGVEHWKSGDRVCSLVSSGGYAEYVLADARHCLPVPDGLSLTEAAGLPETVLTVWSNVFQRMHVSPGETVLVQGGTSGIGLTLIQLGKALGVKIVATAGTDEKCRFAEQWGASRCINYKTEDFEQVLGENSVDAVLDYIGGDYTEKHLRILKPEGRLCWLAGLDGIKSTINIMQIMQKRLTLTGSTLSPRDNDFKAQLTADVEKRVWPYVENGQIKTPIFRTYRLEEAAQAHELMESGDHMGKIILTMENQQS